MFKILKSWYGLGPLAKAGLGQASVAGSWRPGVRHPCRWMVGGCSPWPLFTNCTEIFQGCPCWRGPDAFSAHTGQPAEEETADLCLCYTWTLGSEELIVFLIFHQQWNVWSSRKVQNGPQEEGTRFNLQPWEVLLAPSAAGKARHHRRQRQSYAQVVVSPTCRGGEVFRW